MEDTDTHFTDTITLTFGDQAENHVGMQKIGKMADAGFSSEDMARTRAFFEERGFVCEYIELMDSLVPYGQCTDAVDVMPNEKIPAHLRAPLLIIRGGVNAFSLDESLESLSDSSTAISLADLLYQEQSGLPKDTKAKMYGRVVNKYARHNLCFADESQEPDYAEGKGRIVAYRDVPYLAHLRQSIEQVVGEAAKDLAVEGNYYFDVDKCGIGYHGDSERRKVIGVRLGDSIPLCFAWYYQKSFIPGTKVEILLNHGDMYMMSEKATGQDWKKSSILTLRHAAGCDKYTRI
jgi:alkylated DNA repair dioxygenase AlkB